MSESWRLLDLGLSDPYAVEPMKEVLLTAVKRNLIPDTLCFCMPERFVYVSKHANVRKRVNLEYCRDEGISIIRDIGGGRGASVFDGDILQYNLVSKGKLVNSKLMNCVTKGLQFMELEAEVKPNSNDILVNGKKVSGNTFLLRGGFIVFGGTVIMDFNYDFCEKALLSPPELFVNKKAKSHSEWVTTLNIERGREVSYSEVTSALRKGFESVLQVDFDVLNSLTEAEKKILEGFQEKYRSEEWTKYGRWSPVKDYWRPK